MVDRPKKSDYYFSIAQKVAGRSTCLRRKYGAIIVKNDEIIATGYNGAPRGETNCSDTEKCWRTEHNIPHGEQYEKCVAVHAEMNAIISAARKDMIGSEMYLAGFDDEGKPFQAFPCKICARLIKNAGIKYIVNQTIEDALNFEV